MEKHEEVKKEEAGKEEAYKSETQPAAIEDADMKCDGVIQGLDGSQLPSDLVH